MRARLLPVVLLLSACGEPQAARPDAAAQTAWPVDGFLSYLPEEAALLVRLPTLTSFEADPTGYDALLRALGHDEKKTRTLLFGAETHDGLDGERGPGLVRSASGNWVRYFPAADKGRLNGTLRALLGRRTMREEKSWIILSDTGQAGGAAQGEPLPRGDLAVRVRHHPLLAVVAQPGDQLELGITVGGGGLDLSGKLVPGEATDTAAALREAHAGAGDLLDYIPSWLALRIETTLPPTFLTEFLTRRVALHGGLKGDEDRIRLERFLRELFTAVDRDTGLGIGIEFRDGIPTIVVIGRVADGPDSPILARMRRASRSSFGALVLDSREAPGGMMGWEGWLAEPEPRLDGLPESAWPLVQALAGTEEDPGLMVSYVAVKKWFIAAVGPRSDHLVHGVRKRLLAGATRSPGSTQLRLMRERGEGADYLLGIVFNGAGLRGVADADRKALTEAFSAGEAAIAPDTVAIAGFREDGALKIEARVLYQAP